MARPRLAVTLGDPRGIGAEIVRKALADTRVRAACDAVVIGPTGLQMPVDEAVGDWNSGGTEAVAGRLAALAIERAVVLVRDGAVRGIVTAPIDKHALLAG